jgi:hypothetical protein
MSGLLVGVSAGSEALGGEEADWTQLGHRCCAVFGGEQQEQPRDQPLPWAHPLIAHIRPGHLPNGECTLHTPHLSQSQRPFLARHSKTHMGGI